MIDLVKAVEDAETDAIAAEYEVMRPANFSFPTKHPHVWLRHRKTGKWVLAK